jgi:hypothetical protein
MARSFLDAIMPFYINFDVLEYNSGGNLSDPVARP